MGSKHNLTFADQVYVGGGNFPPLFSANERRGAPVNFLTKVSLGEPGAADDDGIVDAATSTELPDTETVTYTTADDGTTPFDNADTPAPSTIQTSTGASASVWALDVPRALEAKVTHGSSVVAMTITVSGYDVYGQAMSELFTATAGTTSKTVTGTKAFKYIESIAITAAADAEANTLNLGWTDVLGLPYKAAAVADVVRVFFNDVLDDSATVVAADTTTATTGTGDVRGTVDTNSAADDSEVVVWMHVADPNTEAGLRGVDQA
jgi:hypothetical protein